MDSDLPTNMHHLDKILPDADNLSLIDPPPYFDKVLLFACSNFNTRSTWVDVPLEYKDEENKPDHISSLKCVSEHRALKKFLIKF